MKQEEKRRFSFRRVYPHKPLTGVSAIKLETTISKIAEIIKEIQKLQDVFD